MQPKNYLDYPAEYQKYNSQYPKKEVLGWQLYDTVQFVSAGTTTLTLFTITRATIDLSNMEVAGQLAAPKGFLIRGIRFKVKQIPRKEARAANGNVQPGAIDNIAQLTNTGVLSLTIGAKNYGQFPLWRLPDGGGQWGTHAIEGNLADPGDYIDFAGNGEPDASNLYTLTKPIFIAPQMNFRVDLFWPAVITLSGGSTNVSVVLEGDLLRPVQ